MQQTQQTIKCPDCNAEIQLTLDQESMNYSINVHITKEHYMLPYNKKYKIGFALTQQYNVFLEQILGEKIKVTVEEI